MFLLKHTDLKSPEVHSCSATSVSGCVSAEKAEGKETKTTKRKIIKTNFLLPLLFVNHFRYIYFSKNLINNSRVL